MSTAAKVWSPFLFLQFSNSGKWWKSVHIYVSYHKIKTAVSLLWTTLVPIFQSTSWQCQILCTCIGCKCYAQLQIDYILWLSTFSLAQKLLISLCRLSDCYVRRELAVDWTMHRCRVKSKAVRGVARGGHGWMSPRYRLNKLAPELQTDDWFATGVTRQTLQLQHYKQATCISAKYKKPSCR